MSNPTKPAWPDPGAFPFGLFGASAPGATSPAAGFAQPIAQGLTNGVDLMKKMLGQMPGASAIPGFLLPTVDIEELDKRIADLRAAESWLDVNLTMLRATIQGLEVQRNTIAAIKTFGALGTQAAAAPTPSAAAALGGLPPGWPMNAVPDEPPPAPAPFAAPVEPVEPTPPKPRAPRAKTAVAKSAPASPTDTLASMAANNWLGYMQDQFSKVAKAALATSPAAAGAPPTAKAPGKKVATKAARKRRKAAPKA